MSQGHLYPGLEKKGDRTCCKHSVIRVVPIRDDRQMLDPVCGEWPWTEVDMETKREELTAAEHAQLAQSQGKTVVEYCRETGLSVHALYNARHDLKEKGVVPGAPSGVRFGRSRGSS